ncbi:MAG: SUMF1/EgtB/PvdO family nonheme iron enzyme, partial [Ketobacter sp.]|nr:SUMF1/EgtB/PvdO family nonheme iron enzyme [Ketobacter sp.]
MRGQIVPTSSHTRDLTGQTVNYFCPVLKGAELPAYYISRYPVTNIQYQPFIENGDYDDPNWWTEEGWAWCQGSQADVSFIEDK